MLQNYEVKTPILRVSLIVGVQSGIFDALP